MRWNTVLFDLDGTVTDPKEGITCAVAYALRQQGIIADPDTTFYSVHQYQWSRASLQ